MNKRRMPARSARRRKTPLERIDDHLSQSDDGSNAELLHLMRIAMFADVERLKKPGTAPLPKFNDQTT